MAGIHKDIKPFDGEAERISGALKTMREALGPAAALLATSASERSLPQEALLDAEEARLTAEGPERRVVEEDLARLAFGLWLDIEARRNAFDNRDTPTRPEKLIGMISKAAMRRRQRARFRDPTLLSQLAETLRRLNRLVGLATEERAFLAAQRRQSENQLSDFIDHRSEIMEKLGKGAGAAINGIEAARQTERFVTVFQRFVDALNARIGACNVLLHKLTADAEELLILYRVAAEAAGRDIALIREDFPHLASEMARFFNGMLTIRGLDRRRERANQAFADLFPAETAAQDEPEAEAAAKTTKGGWRFPLLAGLRLLRS